MKIQKIDQIVTQIINFLENYDAYTRNFFWKFDATSVHTF